MKSSCLLLNQALHATYNRVIIAILSNNKKLGNYSQPLNFKVSATWLFLLIKHRII